MKFLLLKINQTNHYSISDHRKQFSLLFSFSSHGLHRRYQSRPTNVSDYCGRRGLEAHDHQYERCQVFTSKKAKSRSRNHWMPFWCFAHAFLQLANLRNTIKLQKWLSELQTCFQSSLLQQLELFRFQSDGISRSEATGFLNDHQARD